MSRTQDRGRAIRCRSHLRQLAVRMHLYADTHRYLAPHRVRNPDGSRTRWMHFFAREIGSGYEVMRDPAVPHWLSGRNAPHGYNYNFLGSARVKFTGEYERFPVALDCLPAPAFTLAFGCAHGTGTNLPYEPLPLEAARSGLPPRRASSRSATTGMSLIRPGCPPTATIRRSAGPITSTPRF